MIISIIILLFGGTLGALALSRLVAAVALSPLVLVTRGRERPRWIQLVAQGMATLVLTYVSLTWTVVVINFVRMRLTTPHGGGAWLLWTIAFGVSSLLPANLFSNGPIEDEYHVVISAVLTSIGFFVLANAPRVLQWGWGWVPTVVS